MAELYSKDFLKTKERARVLLQSLADEMQAMKKAGLKVPGNEPKMALRALRSMLLSPDSVYGDLLEKALTKNWSAKKLKNAIRSQMEGKTKRTKAKAGILRGHHWIAPGSVGDVAQKLARTPTKFRQLLIDLTDEGYQLAESGLSWYIERIHTGAPGKTNLLNTKELVESGKLAKGIPGFNVHQSSTNNPLYWVDPKLEGDELFEALVKSADRQMADVKLGDALMKPVNETIDRIAIEAGIDPNNNQAIQKYLNKNPDLLFEVEAAFNPNVTDEVAQAIIERGALGGNTKQFTKSAEAAGLVQEIADKAADAESFRGGVRITRKHVAGLAIVGATSFSLLGTGASAAETTGRIMLARKSGNPLDWAQAGISGISLGGDIASYNPVTAVPGTVVSTAADVTNISIDSLRDGPKRVRGRYGAKKAIENRKIIERRQRELESTVSAYDWRNPPDEPLW